MKLLLHMNMPSGKNDGTHQLIMDAPEVSSLLDVAHLIARASGILHGNHLLYERLGDGRRVWRSRGPIIINFAHVGKIAEYYEGENEAH